MPWWSGASVTSDTAHLHASSRGEFYGGGRSTAALAHCVVSDHLRTTFAQQFVERRAQAGCGNLRLQQEAALDSLQPFQQLLLLAHPFPLSVGVTGNRRAHW